MHQRLEPVVVAIDRTHSDQLWIADGSGCTDELEDREAVDRAEQTPRDHLSGEGAPAVRSDRGTDGLHARLRHRRLAGHECAPPGDGVPAGYSSFVGRMRTWLNNTRSGRGRSRASRDK